MNPISRTRYNWLIQKINNQIVEKNLNLLRGTVLDLGCGPAPYKKEILERADAYFGVDWPGTLHRNANMDVSADLTEPLPFGHACADTVTLFQVLEHIAEPQQLLCEINRLLKPDGHLLMTVPFMWRVHEAPHDYYRYTRYGLEYMLRKAGFRRIQITENTGFWQTFLMKFNYHSVRYSSGIRRPFRPLWIPLWWLNQTIAPWLDRLDRHPQETASYTVIAQK